MSRLLHKLRFRFSEPYRIRIGCGLNPLRNEREIRALINFCKTALKDDPSLEYNTEKKALFEFTVLLAESGDTWSGPLVFEWNFQEYRTVYQLVEDYIGWYWS